MSGLHETPEEKTDSRASRRPRRSDWDDPIVRVSRGERPPLSNLKLVVILTDGIYTRLNQSRGVALWLSRRTGAEILELEIPELKGVRRRKAYTAVARLLEGNRRKARDWLTLAEGENVIRTLGQWLVERGIREGDASSLILLSTGSMPSFYNVALGYIWRCTCAAITTPSVIGTEPFDFAIVPEYDYPLDLSNILTTVGAPNLIVREELGGVAASLLRQFPPQSDRRWGVLIGGDDANYRITADWVQKRLGKVFHEAHRSNVDLYIATSRRTSRDAENSIRRLAANSDRVRFLLIASADPLNPVPAILGACDEVFVTDDSISMVSEAATAGHRVVLLRTERVGAVKRKLQKFTSALVTVGLLPKKTLWGIPRFDQGFRSFEKMGLLIEFKDWMKERRRDNMSPFAPLDDDMDFDPDGFNEARRAADWILENLGDVVHPSEDE
ncbi:MAG: mitochondrial fission ELM1 family protein [Synergistaceae bacterium]|nr:mitochondrial fission ELM1 family protein [Synergistaceae bacterium]